GRLVDIERGRSGAGGGGYRAGATAIVWRILEGLPGHEVRTEAESVAGGEVRVRRAERGCLDVNGTSALILVNPGHGPTTRCRAEHAVIEIALVVAERQHIGVAERNHVGNVG